VIVEFGLDAVEAHGNFTLHFIEPPVDIVEPSVHRIERLIIDPDRNQDREHDGQRGRVDILGWARGMAASRSQIEFGRFIQRFPGQAWTPTLPYFELIAGMGPCCR
jgi:hypothetical protein